VTVRYAIYVAPGSGPDGQAGADQAAADQAAADQAAAALREAAGRWLGRSVDGTPVSPGVPSGWTREAVDAITVDARRYGFHGTLKAPFRLAPGRTPQELGAALAAFAADRCAVTIPLLTLARLGGFFALVPGAEAKELHSLADDVVTAFDSFRAPLTEAEAARRRPQSLTPRQRELLGAWGYPYVLDEFRFHLTVTDSIPQERRTEVAAALQGWFGHLLGADVPATALALFTEASPGAPFLLDAVYPLRPSSPISPISPVNASTASPTNASPITASPSTASPISEGA
jgi:hypothetical protein